MTVEQARDLVLAAGLPALAALAGGVGAILLRPSTLSASIIFGFAGGAILGTIGLEMLPRAVAESGVWLTVASLSAGFVAVYALDLVAHRGVVAGERAEQRRRVELAYRTRPPRAGEALFFAGAITVEQVVEGLTIGVSLALAPQLALIVGLAVAVDNLSEGMAIAELFRSEAGADNRAARGAAVLWTGTAGLALFLPAAVAWFALRELPILVHGALVAGAAGAMLYLTFSDLLPEGQQRHYQQSAALAGASGFAVVLVLSSLGAS